MLSFPKSARYLARSAMNCVKAGTFFAESHGDFRFSRGLPASPTSISDLHVTQMASRAAASSSYLDDRAMNPLRLMISCPVFQAFSSSSLVMACLGSLNISALLLAGLVEGPSKAIWLTFTLKRTPSDQAGMKAKNFFGRSCWEPPVVVATHQLNSGS